MTKSLLKRIERVELVAKAQSRFSSQCICFPENEPPSFNWPVEQQIAAKVKCSLHGGRFRPLTFFIHVSKWLREKKQRLLLTHHSEQYRKAWYASFPADLWPAEEVETDGRLDLRLKDGFSVPVD